VAKEQVVILRTMLAMRSCWTSQMRNGIFARAEEVEETKIRHVCRGAAKGVASKIGRAVDVVEERKGNRFDAAGWGILFGVALVEGGEADVKVARAV